MKQAIFIQVFACASVWYGVTAWAHAQSDTAYYSGDNDVPVGPREVQPPFEDFVAGVQGDLITVTAKGDECGRSFYIKGTFHFDGIADPDSPITGTMSRCTNPKLVDRCNHQKNYQVPFKGTIQRKRGDVAGSRQLIIDITYPLEKWLVQNCTNPLTDDGDDSLVLTEAAPDKRLPTGKIINDDIEEAEKLIIDGIMKGMRKPR